MKRYLEDRGAVAVEFALVLPVLLLLVLGTIEFGRAYNAQITLTQAARESVRSLAISNNPATAKTRAGFASSTLSPAVTDAQIVLSFADSVSPFTTQTSCGVGRNAIVTITYPLQTISGIVGPVTLTGKAVMRCAG